MTENARNLKLQVCHNPDLSRDASRPCEKNIAGGRVSIGPRAQKDFAKFGRIG